MYTPETNRRVEEILRPWSEGAVLPPARDQTNRAADGQCEACGELFTWSALTLDHECSSLQCPACRERAANREKLKKSVAILKMPGFYVALTVLLAGVLWLAGFGSPTPAALKAGDKGKDWHMQRYPRALLAKAKRTAARARRLHQQGNATGAAHWAKMAEPAFTEAAEMWKGQAVEPPLRFGAAQMLRIQGDKAGAYTAMRKLDGKFALDEGAGKGYLYNRGVLALELGRKDAGKRDLELLLGELTKDPDMGAAFNKMIDNAIEIGEKGHDPGKGLVAFATVAAGFDFPCEEVEAVLRAMEKHGVKSELARQISNRRGRPLPDDHTVEGEAGGLKFEEVEDH